jgi:hypothetical protein
MWIQERRTVSPDFHLRSGQGIFHQTLADPHSLEGEVKATSYTDIEGLAFGMAVQCMTSILPQIYLMVVALQIIPLDSSSDNR